MIPLFFPLPTSFMVSFGLMGISHSNCRHLWRSPNEMYQEVMLVHYDDSYFVNVTLLPSRVSTSSKMGHFKPIFLRYLYPYSISRSKRYFCFCRDTRKCYLVSSLKYTRSQNRLLIYTHLAKNNQRHGVLRRLNT